MTRRNKCGLTDNQMDNMNEWFKCMKEIAGLDMTAAIKIFNTLEPTEQRDIYSKRWIRRGDIVPVKRDLLPARFTEINSRRAQETKMAKIHISPKMIALMVQNAKTSEEIQAVYDLVKDSAHAYQLGWITEQKLKMQLREKQQQQQQETKK